MPEGYLFLIYCRENLQGKQLLLSCLTGSQLSAPHNSEVSPVETKGLNKYRIHTQIEFSDLCKGTQQLGCPEQFPAWLLLPHNIYMLLYWISSACAELSYLLQHEVCPVLWKLIVQLVVSFVFNIWNGCTVLPPLQSKCKMLLIME